MEPIAHVLLASSTHGNVIGRIVTPLEGHCTSKRDLLENSVLQIGMISDEKLLSEEFPEDDVRKVTQDLVAYLESEGVTISR